MAATTAPKHTSIKALAESPGLTSIPPNYAFAANPKEFFASEPEDSIPIIDFSLLTSGDPVRRSQVVQDLGRACEDWGFFIVVNHGVAERLMKGAIDTCEEFFNQREEEKQEYETRHVLDPIRWGTSFNTKVDKVFCWRDFLKVLVHPHFHSPSKPAGFREMSRQYSNQTRKMAIELLRGISGSLGLEDSYIEKEMGLDSGLQIFTGNFYPPCPQPQLALGLPPHSDHGLLTLLIQNDIGGLQIQHNGNWINVNAPRNSFLVNTGDHLEILSNGRYKSVLHRAIVNNKATRISVAMANGPSPDAIVGPSAQLVDEGHPPAYIPMAYKEYLELQQSNQLDAKSCLDRVRLQIVL